MKNKRFSPIFTFIILTLGTIILSFILSLFDFQAEYSTVNSVTNSVQNNVVAVTNLLSSEGLKYIFSNTISNFVNFEPFGYLIIILVGIGVLEKSGFSKTFCTLLTQNSRKNTVTFVIILLSVISSIFGNMGYVLLLPIAALIFKYGHRNPLGGVIASFAGVSFGYGINIFISSIDSSLLNYTEIASHIIDSKYSINNFYGLIFMIVSAIIASILLTRVTEKKVIPKLGKYEYEEVETLDNKALSKRELRALVLSLGAFLIYLLIIIYMIIPGLPLSGSLLDSSASTYIDKLFGVNSLFREGFIFIISFMFIIIGLVYGIVTKVFNNEKDISESLSYSLDNMGHIIVLLFAASLFINTFNKSNIGLVIVALLTNLFESINIGGAALIIGLLIISFIGGLFYTGMVSKWEIMSGTVVPMFMNNSISPEFAQIIYSVGTSLSYGLTPLMLYYVLYLAYLEKYKSDENVSILNSFKYMSKYFVVMFIMWFILILCFYIIGIPLGVNTSSLLAY